MSDLIERRCGHAEDVRSLDRDADFYLTETGKAQLRTMQARLCKACKAKLTERERQAYATVEAAVARLALEY